MGGSAHPAVAQALKTARNAFRIDVVYVAGSDRVPVQAVKTESDVDVFAADGTATVVRVTDFRILAEDLVVYGREVEPSTGHRIEIFERNRRQVYEVMPVVGDACFEKTDPFGEGYKIHTKLIDED